MKPLLLLVLGLALAGCCDRNCMSSGDGDADGEIDEDCTPGEVGEEPYTDLDACLVAVACAPPALLSPMDDMELCLAREQIEDAPPGYGTYEQVFATQLVLWYLDEINDNASCLTDAATCEDALRCLNGGSDPAVCTTPSPDIATWGHGCTGNVLSICLATVTGTTSGTLFTHDCSAEGLSCVSTPSMAACMNTDCTTPGEPTCVDNVIDHCVQTGAHHRIDCVDILGDTEATCGDGDPDTAGIQAGCVPTGDPCDPATDEPYCDSRELRVCHEVFERWTAFDCTGIGENWTCTPEGCVPGVTDCDFSLEPVCDCDDLLVCDPRSGRDIRVHCPDYGFLTCDESLGECS